jgi:hypothetical protein
VRWKVDLFRLWIVGSICWIAYWVWDQWPTEENELTCWRRLIGVEKGERCEFNLSVLGSALIEIFRPALLVGVAILAVAWIAAGFQRRASATHPRGAKMKLLNGVYIEPDDKIDGSLQQLARQPSGSAMMLRKILHGIADGFMGRGFQQRSVSDRVAYGFGQLIGWMLWIAVVGLLVAAAYHLSPAGTWQGVHRTLPWMILTVVLIAVIWGISELVEEAVYRMRRRRKKDPVAPQE